MAGASPRQGRWYDSADGYGWISILLHWVVAALILVLWFVGDSIVADPSGGARRLHTTLGLTAYALLWARVIWRLRSGHPRRLAKQGPLTYLAGKAIHYVMIGALTVLLFSGPLQALSAGQPLHLFDLTMQTPAIPWLFAPMHTVHRWAATVLILCVIAHIIAVVKHIIWDRDGSFDRIMVPGGGAPPEQKAEQAPPH